MVTPNRDSENCSKKEKIGWLHNREAALRFMCDSPVVYGSGQRKGQAEGYWLNCPSGI